MSKPTDASALWVPFNCGLHLWSCKPNDVVFLNLLEGAFISESFELPRLGLLCDLHSLAFMGCVRLPSALGLIHGASDRNAGRISHSFRSVCGISFIYSSLNMEFALEHKTSISENSYWQ